MYNLISFRGNSSKNLFKSFDKNRHIFFIFPLNFFLPWNFKKLRRKPLQINFTLEFSDMLKTWTVFIFDGKMFRNYFYVKRRFLVNRAYSHRSVWWKFSFSSRAKLFFYQNMRERALMKLVSDVWMHGVLKWRARGRVFGGMEKRGNESNVIKMKILMWSDNVELCRTRYDKMLLMNESEEQISLQGWKKREKGRHKSFCRVW